MTMSNTPPNCVAEKQKNNNTKGYTLMVQTAIAFQLTRVTQSNKFYSIHCKTVFNQNEAEMNISLLLIL